MLGTMVRGMKDGALSMAFKNFINEKFAEYGKVTDILVDTEANRLTIEAVLKGEREPITATVLRYDIEKTAEGTFVVLKRFDSSREWLTMLLTKLFSGKRYALPNVVARLL
jgi:sporulation protein YlmC with PRC-barrel domain